MECHDRNEISKLQTEMPFCSTLRADGPLPCFKIHDVDYYPKVAGNKLPWLMNQGYSFLVLDMGNLGEADFEEFLRCDRKLVIGSLSPWKIEKYRNFFELYNGSVNLGEGFYYLVQMGLSKNIPEFTKTYHISMCGVPPIPNPFRLEKELFQFLQELVS